MIREGGLAADAAKKIRDFPNPQGPPWLYRPPQKSDRVIPTYRETIRGLAADAAKKIRDFPTPQDSPLLYRPPQKSDSSHIHTVRRSGGLPPMRQRKSEIFRTRRVLFGCIVHHKKATGFLLSLFCGGRSGTRTLGPLIKSQLLYQLS